VVKVLAHRPELLGELKALLMKEEVEHARCMRCRCSSVTAATAMTTGTATTNNIRNRGGTVIVPGKTAARAGCNRGTRDMHVKN
jgi:hypothetical protein